MDKKIISSKVWSEIQQEAKARAQRVRGCRQKVKAEASELIRLIAQAPEADEKEFRGVRLVVFTHVENLGSKKWPDAYKAVNAWELGGLKETKKRYTNMFKEYVNKDAVLCYVAWEVGYDGEI